MPTQVAIKRTALSELPKRDMLTDGDSPMPASRLSQLSRVQVVARVSRSGVTNAQAGHLESTTRDVQSDAETSLTINRTR